MGDVRVHAAGLRKRFFRKGRDAARYFDAVAGIDLDLRAGELAAVMGRSGSGKSTLLNMLAGLLEPTEGSVEVDGVDLYALPDAQLAHVRNEKIGVVPQGASALHALSVIENVMLPYSMYRSGDDIEERALGLLDALGISALADAFPRELSGGEMRRMAIVRALVCEPAVVLADEPTADLDDATTETVMGLLRATADAGVAVLVVTHDRTVDSFADRVIELGSGALHREAAAGLSAAS